MLGQAGECPSLTVSQEWPTGFHGILDIRPDHEVHGWNMVLTFDKPFTNFIVRIRKFICVLVLFPFLLL